MNLGKHDWNNNNHYLVMLENSENNLSKIIHGFKMKN